MTVANNLRAILAWVWRKLCQSPDPGLGDHIGFAPLADLMEGRLD
ncbi:MAG: hypothetical protein O9322_00720 [Beijerinckiaceae bacterium]|nr:hypothetical protein [Beijerinckiaceae bacterium]MCZ8301790.1 hypothetical protein [Beijerinckiaceae bacterium]